MAIKLTKKGTDNFCVTITGNALSGKTTLAGKQLKPLFLSTDGKAAKQGYDAIQFNTVQLIKELPEFIKSGEYQTIVFDVIEELEEVCEKDVKKKHNVDVLTDEMQQEVVNYYKAVINQLVNNYNVVFLSRTAQTKKEKIVADVTSRGLGYVLGRSTAVLHVNDSHEVTIENNMVDIKANKNFIGVDWKSEE
jgi:hypothetical protein